MKELFRKLSNLFSFGKENRLVNEGDIDKSGPNLIDEYTDKERSEFKTVEKKPVSTIANARVAKADTGLIRMEQMKLPPKKRPEPKAKPRKLTDKEKYILDFEKPGGKTILPKQAEYLKVERVEASKGEEVKPEIPDLVPISPDIKYTFKVPVGLDISDEVVEKALNKLVLSKRSADMGYAPEEMKNYLEHLSQETIKSLAQTAINLENKGMGYQVEELAEDLNSDMRDYEKYKTSKGYKYDEEGMNNLIASYTETPEEMHPIIDEEKPIELSDEAVAELTGGFEGDEEWGPEKAPGKTPTEEGILEEGLAGGREKNKSSDTPSIKPRQ